MHPPERCTWLPGDPRDLLTPAEKDALYFDLARIAEQRRALYDTTTDPKEPRDDHRHP